MAPGASGFADLKASVMRLMELPPETRVHPGHREPTTIGDGVGEATPSCGSGAGSTRPARSR